MWRHTRFGWKSAVTWLLAGCLLAAGATFGSCATTESSEKGALTESGEADPNFFDEIPADPLYVMASVDHGSEEMKSFSVGAGTEGNSLFSAWQSYLKNFVSEESDDGAAWMQALVEEFEDVESLEGYRELGLEPLAPNAIYALGGLPVFRSTLADGEKFREFLNRFESNAGVEAEVIEHNGKKVHMYSPESLVAEEWDSEKGGMVEAFRFKVALTVRDGQVIVASYPTGVQKRMLDHITGASTPEETMGDASAIRTLNRKYGYEPFARAGWVDVASIVRVLTEQSKPTELGARVMKIMEMETTSLDSTCETEVSQLIEQVPRFVVGVETYTREMTAVEMGLEVESEISQTLGELGAEIPGYGSDMYDEAFMSFGMGINVEKYVDFGVEQASSIVNEPYECDKLEGLNEIARQTTRMTSVIPAALRQVKSASFMVKDFALKEESTRPEAVEAVALVRARNPQSLIAQLRTVVQEIQELQITADGAPVALKSIANRIPGVDAVHLAYTEDYIGASMGMKGREMLASFLESPRTGSDSPLLSIGADLGSMTQLVSERLDEVLDSATGQEASEVDEEAAEKVAELLGMSFLELDATENGVFMRYRVTMNPDAAGGSSASASK